ncbi:mycothiol synthase [Salininema proteolyticum]|uniref:Mycothiol acetyltransferase n=1 Tax=Salininema proteolyticum TaxID=1607685 RepID=A0ABV8TWS9_9ACTN
MALVEALSDDQVRGIRRLAERSLERDGVEALNEQTLLNLDRAPGPGFYHFVLGSGDDVTGYAQMEIADGDAHAEMTVDPDHRREGHGRRLMEDLVTTATGEAEFLRLWAHGDTSAAQKVAESEGFSRDRVLFELGMDASQMDWPESWPEGAGEWPTGSAPAAVLPQGFSLRHFDPGTDEDELVRVNAAAFADHPEQGRWTFEDVITREQEEWFDPEGIILAFQGDALRGFHWTKMVPENGAGIVGEIYVVGIDPPAQGTGLGKVLTLAGMAHMAARGATTLTLFVDESNSRAVRLYRNQGFETVRTDVQYKRPLE